MSWSSPLTALSHLSDEAVAAFADGVLGDTARQRAQSHMAGCAECSEAVYGQRAARAALRSALTPRLPAGLFERLRELPITAELPPVLFPSVVSADGQAFYAATPPVALTAAVTPPLPFPVLVPADREPALVASATGHRRTSARVGLGATAAALLAVGVLATTAANAGGVTPAPATVQPVGYGQHSGAATRTDRRTPAHSVDAPMQMTMLTVPSSGR
jgi:hypothetical protein